MQKIVINGSVDRAALAKELKETDTQLFFNLHPKSDSEINSYDAVFFLNESDDFIAEWVGANHLRISTSEKALLDEIRFFLGIPQRLEIERKFLIEHPSIELLESERLCRCAEIEQCYITSPTQFRVRKRGLSGDYIFIKTEKKSITSLIRAETESYITEDEYNRTIKGNKVLNKKRYLYVYENQYFEIDIFPFWKSKALLEIELKSEDEPYTLPPFVKVIKEVTENNYYKNKQIAKRHGIINE